MSTLAIWLLIGLLALSTVISRSVIPLFFPNIMLPPWLEKGLVYAPISALAAVVVPEVVLNQGAVDLSWHNPQLIAAIGGVACFFLVRHILVTVFVGMLLLVLLR